MNNKLVLTSAVVFGFMCPAVATPSHTSNTFPSNGLMEADYTYTGQATYDNIGAYGGDVIAEAEYEFIDYNLGPGQYLPQSSTTITQCTTGSFCTGIGNVHYDTTTDQGITACSTVGDHSYTLSDLGSSAASDCYRNCASGDVANLKSGGTMTGRVFSNNVNTCGPSDANQCANGYHYTAGVTNPDLMTAIGVSSAGTNIAFKSNNSSTGYSTDASTLNQYGLTENGTFVVDYGNGKKIRGKSQCTTRRPGEEGILFDWEDYDYHNVTSAYIVTSDNFTSELPNSTGQYCYCQLDGYTLTNGAMQSLATSWVFQSNALDEDLCVDDCAYHCAFHLQYNDTYSLTFREAIFSLLQSTPASCDANIITIRWGDTDDADVTANNAGTATYGSDIRTPVKAQTKPGKTFKGWRFSAPAQSGS